MDQFREGLEIFGVYQYISKYPDIMQPLFVDESTNLTASMLRFCKSTLPLVQ